MPVTPPRRPERQHCRPLLYHDENTSPGSCSRFAINEPCKYPIHSGRKGEKMGDNPCARRLNTIFWGVLSNGGMSKLFTLCFLHEDYLICESRPPQGLSEARRGRVVIRIWFAIRRGGVPSGAAAFIVYRNITIPPSESEYG